MTSLRKFLTIPFLLAPLASFSAEVTIRPPVSEHENVVIPDQDLSNEREQFIDPPMLDKLTPEYLKDNPTELETLLSNMVVIGDDEGLKKYLPVYREIPDHDPSLIEWGEAIIAARSGDFKTAIAIYRKINAALPDVDLVRFQLAIALYSDRQTAAAKNEFEKLRSKNLPEPYASVIDQYLGAIHKQNDWDINAGATYVYDKNVNNAPPKGTTVVFPNGATVVSKQEPESGNGVQFNFSADKRFALKDNWFSALHLSTSGKLFLDAKEHNDLNVRVGAGIGYANATTEIELAPFVSHRWYIDKKDNNSKFDYYNKGYGLRVEGSQWLSRQIKYQGAFEWGRNHYRDNFKHLNGNDYLFSNTLLYLRNPKQYWFVGADYSLRDTHSDSNSYQRIGTRLGWGQEWGKGISTRTSVGYARKVYDGADFFAIRQKNNEYNASLTLWNRDWHFGGITPRLTWNFNKVKGNHPFYNYDNNNIYVDFSKTF